MLFAIAILCVSTASAARPWRVNLYEDKANGSRQFITSFDRPVRPGVEIVITNRCGNGDPPYRYTFNFVHGPNGNVVMSNVFGQNYRLDTENHKCLMYNLVLQPVDDGYVITSAHERD